MGAFDWLGAGGMPAEGGMGGLGGTQVTQRPSNAAPLGQTVMGGALSGALLGSKFFPGIGTLAGAGLGGLMGAL
jgi:hypothetical protein